MSPALSEAWSATQTTSISPTLPPPIIIAPRSTQLDSGMQPPSALPHLKPPISDQQQVKAPAVDIATESRGRVPRPITGRGCRDQLPAVRVTNTTVSYVFVKLST